MGLRCCPLLSETVRATANKKTVLLKYLLAMHRAGRTALSVDFCHLTRSRSRKQRGPGMASAARSRAAPFARNIIFGKYLNYRDCLDRPLDPLRPSGRTEMETIGEQHVISLAEQILSSRTLRADANINSEKRACESLTGIHFPDSSILRLAIPAREIARDRSRSLEIARDPGTFRGHARARAIRGIRATCGFAYVVRED